MSLFFIAGTDTGVGKTLVTALLGLHFQAQSKKISVIKPFASGCERENGELRSEDADLLSQTLGIECECPLRLEEPLAPLVAARRANISTRAWFDQTVQTIESMARDCGLVLVEGVGGLLVPVGEDETGVWTCERLIQHFEMPTVLVARRTLGTINHSMLTLSRPEIPFRGLIFNDAAPIEADDVAAQTSPELISELAGVPIWGEVPFCENKNAATLQNIAARLQVPKSALEKS